MYVGKTIKSKNLEIILSGRIRNQARYNNIFVLYYTIIFNDKMISGNATFDFFNKYQNTNNKKHIIVNVMSSLNNKNISRSSCKDYDFIENQLIFFSENFCKNTVGL